MAEADANDSAGPARMAGPIDAHEHAPPRAARLTRTDMRARSTARLIRTHMPSKEHRPADPHTHTSKEQGAHAPLTCT